MHDLHDLDELDPPDEDASVEELWDTLGALVERHNELITRVQRADKLAVKALEDSRSIDRDVDTLRSELEDLQQHLDIVDASMPDQQQDKLGRIRGILSYAVAEATGGPAGVIVETGEATAAAQTSRNTALRLMDEIGSNFEWASVKNPGGPNPKQLRLAIRDRDVHDLMDDVRAHYQHGGAVSG